MLGIGRIWRKIGKNWQRGIMEKVRIRPLMTLPKDKHEFMIQAADDMGISFNQYASLCLTAGIRSMQKTAESESLYTAAELGEFLKGIGFADKLVKETVKEVAADEKKEAKKRVAKVK